MHAANDVIMPVLGMVQETGKVIRWLIDEGQPVEQGQPLLEVETDKAVAEIEAPASGILSGVKAFAGDDVPVGTVIAVILPAEQTSTASEKTAERPATKAPLSASPLAARIAAENGVDLVNVHSQGTRIEKADVLAYLNSHQSPETAGPDSSDKPARTLSSPKARRMAADMGIDISLINGSGPEGAVLTQDVLTFLPENQQALPDAPVLLTSFEQTGQVEELPQSAIWRIMVERTTQAWREAPHFFLLREVDASRLVAWREILVKKSGLKVTYTDLLVKLSAAALRKHPRINSSVQGGKVLLMPEINIGIAAAVEDGLVVPVIHNASAKTISEIASDRLAVLERARAGRLRPADIQGGTFTISNLGMYGVDSFLAVLNPPQAAILAAGRIVERVVPVNGQVVIRPVMALSLSFDHRAIDGAHGAQFLDTLAGLIEEPLSLLE